MKQLIYSALFLLAASAANAQWYNPDKVNAKAQFVYSGAIDALRDGDWQAGKNLLRRAVQMEPKFVDAWLSMGGASGQLKQYDSAVLFYEKAVALDSVYSREFYLPYSINLAGLGRFEEAQQKIGQFLQLPRLDSRSMEAAKYRASTYAFALAHRQRKQSDTLQFRPVNMGVAVNSPKSEYYPSFTINDSIFVFTRRAEGFREDFYKSVRINGVYQPAELLQGNLNEEPSKGGLVISQDGEMLVFAGNFRTGL